jgi:hypothetical protein
LKKQQNQPTYQAEPLPSGITSKLHELYYNPKTGLGGIDSLWKRVKEDGIDVTRRDVINWLRRQTIYALYRPAINKYQRNQYRMEYCGQMFQFDLASFVNEPDKIGNQTMKYCFFGQDSFSRFSFAQPVPTNTATHVINALREVIKQKLFTIESVLSDGAAENTSRAMKTFLEEHNIRAVVTKSDKHTPQVTEIGIATKLGQQTF